MHILILGGTVFYGRHLTETALRRGHHVTLFNRGIHGPELFPEANHVRGDRDGGIQALRGISFDAVVDTSGQIPRTVGDSAALLKDAVGHYTFISSLSVYSDVSQRGVDESGRVDRLENPEEERLTNETYGPMKVACEDRVRETFDTRALILRPGLIVGPYDWTDRFTYWPARVARGGAMLAPQSPEIPVQFIDARDLSEWTLDAVERSLSGTFNATGPESPATLGDVLEAAIGVTGSDAVPVWVDAEFLREHEVLPWMQMPLWVGDGEEEKGFSHIDCRRAIAEGLRFRPLEETIVDTLRWFGTQGSRRLRAGLEPDREQALLEAWRSRD